MSILPPNKCGTTKYLNILSLHQIASRCHLYYSSVLLLASVHQKNRHKFFQLRKKQLQWTHLPQAFPLACSSTKAFAPARWLNQKVACQRPRGSEWQQKCKTNATCVTCMSNHSRCLLLQHAQVNKSLQVQKSRRYHFNATSLSFGRSGSRDETLIRSPSASPQPLLQASP